MGYVGILRNDNGRPFAVFDYSLRAVVKRLLLAGINIVHQLARRAILKTLHMFQYRLLLRAAALQI